MKAEGLQAKNLINSALSGRIEGIIFQKNGIIRIDRRYLTKRMLKKLAKDRP